MKPSETLFVTGGLGDVARARAVGIDSMFLLSGLNSMRDAAFCTRTSRPTYVAVDARALDLPEWTRRPAGEPAAEISPRGKIRLLSVTAPPHEMVEEAVRAAWRDRDRHRIMLSSRPEDWKPVEKVLRDYWEAWAVQGLGQ